MGKMLKRLDNHLSRCHKGVSRAMNDKYRMSSPSSDLGVTCLLPGYGKKKKASPTPEEKHSLCYACHPESPRGWRETKRKNVQTTAGGRETHFKE